MVPQVLFLSFLPLLGKKSQHLTELPSGYSCPCLQAGPGCTWPSTRTPWRATCGCSRRTWACYINTTSSECLSARSHAAPALSLSGVPKTLVTCRHHSRPHQRPRLALPAEGMSVPATGLLGPCLGRLLPEVPVLQLGLCLAVWCSASAQSSLQAADPTGARTLCWGCCRIRVFIAAAASQMALCCRSHI